MNEKHRLGRVALACAGALVLIAMAAPGGAAAKKHHGKHKKPSVYTASVAPNAAVPDPGATGPDGRLDIPFDVGKAFKGKTVGDVQATFQVSFPPSATNAVATLEIYLQAPSGMRLQLAPDLGGLGIGTTIGPLTLGRFVGTGTCPTAGATPCPSPFQPLKPPFAGSAQEVGLGFFNGGPMKGRWTLTVLDTQHLNQATVNLAGLRIAPA